jgi:hypothetical protein
MSKPPSIAAEPRQPAQPPARDSTGPDGAKPTTTTARASNPPGGAEQQRLAEDARRERNWRRWGPYLSERQWGTVREDYSDEGDFWSYLPHDHARSRAYRWGEDGLFGWTDRECRLCFAWAFWNEHDPILKERLFGLAGPEGNHGEDVKELYYYLDATPTFSYARALYRYPQAAFPYADLVAENRRRSNAEREYEIEDTGVFSGGRYFDMEIEFAKAEPDDVLIQLTAYNRGDRPAPLHLLPHLWLRNTWAWGRTGEGYWPKGRISLEGRKLVADHPGLDRFELACDASSGAPRFLFTDNETNVERLFGVPSASPYTKDAFHRLIAKGEAGATRPEPFGTKAAAWWRLELPAHASAVLRLRLRPRGRSEAAFGEAFETTFAKRRSEASAFHLAVRNAPLTESERSIVRQADAGLLWSRQFYHYVVTAWLEGDPAQPQPPEGHRQGRNSDWRHFYARDVISMPDKWEYPWFASWDLAFQAVAMARIDPAFAKNQVLLLLREWYMHPNGAVPAFEIAFGDVNPPLHAWAAWRVYQLGAQQGSGRDRSFLVRAFHKCLVSFTWWLNRKDIAGRNLFAGGFLGLDNVGPFDRSQPVPGGGQLEQADATAWMAFFATTMLAMALELSREEPAYVDMASRFFEHFLAIAHAMNHLGVWDEADGFYYDHAHAGGRFVPLKVRSIAGLVPLFAAESLERERLERVPRFWRRLEWSAANEPALLADIACLAPGAEHDHLLLAIPPRQRLERVLRYVLDERELLSPFGVRSLSKIYAEHPYTVQLDGRSFEVHYAPGESDTGLFGGNSNWRGPVWLPLNYLLIEALKRHHHFYGASLKVECPVGSGQWLTLRQVASELERRLSRLFLTDASAQRPQQSVDGAPARPQGPVLFHEYYHAETGRGCGASHQTGWTALIANVIERVALEREGISKHASEHALGQAPEHASGSHAAAPAG